VLAAFGRAFGKLPENTPTREQDKFLNQAVSGLAQEGKIICVRLALFAEMMKGKSWLPTTLKQVGGTEGIGVTFLEETFAAATAPPEHRHHQKAARAILKELLPESGTDIKGHMQSFANLLVASGYASRPNDFDDLICILDSESRLITPTDPEGKEGEPPSQVQLSEKYYQLTHDYLVPSLRNWLTRKQKETRRGRAELLLADRATVWNARPENRQLPSLLKWLTVRCLTHKKNWTLPQQKLMRKAGHYHAVRGLVLAVSLVLLTLVSWEGFGRLKAPILRDRLLEAPTTDVPGIVNDMTHYHRWVDPLLKEAYRIGQANGKSRVQLHASLALLPVDSAQVEYLYKRLLMAESLDELVVIREALSNHQQDLTDRLWRFLENPNNEQDQRFRASCALAALAPDDSRWEKVGGDVAAMLVSQGTRQIGLWVGALKGVMKWLMPPLADFLVDESRSVMERNYIIANVYHTYGSHVPDAYTLLEERLAEGNKPLASVADKVSLAKRQASIGVALVDMGRGTKVWPLLKHQHEPTQRSFLIERLSPGNMSPSVLTDRLDEALDVSIKRAILLSLGDFGQDRFPRGSFALKRLPQGLQRLEHFPRLLKLYRDDPDPGIHGATERLLREWQADADLKEIDKPLTTGNVEGQRRWYLNRQGQTMVLVPRPGEFWMGEGTERHRHRINRSFALAAKEVTVDQFRRFREGHWLTMENARSKDWPITFVSWYDAVAYCNWLSEQEGIPKEQWCYLPNKAGQYDDEMKMAPNYLRRTGYRLPTEAEWEYGCRAGAETAFSCGEAEELVAEYAWYSGNSANNLHRVGLRKPNDLGLFDMHGNVWEWTQNTFKEYVKQTHAQAVDDTEDPHTISSNDRRVLRGGSFDTPAVVVRSANRIWDVASDRIFNAGFRPARTIAAE
jgi:formylglycine-generating enzyme required for sulfatase activity